VACALIGKRIAMRNTFLCAASFFFYYKSSGIFVTILIFTTLFCYLDGKLIHKASSEGKRKAWLILGLIVNLGTLSYFKYAYFITDMVNQLLGLHLRVWDAFAWIGNKATDSNMFDVDHILLPVGISFFIFQSISYLMDIYRKRILPLGNVLDFGFYVSFFPQLVAGPSALFGYSLQVYADFSGYTDIATGVAMLMGFYLPQNFNSPYKAPNPGNFWKRWHISLSQWLQDYLYIPLGGNRNATFGTYCCIITIALIAVILSGSIWVALVIGAIALAVGTTAVLKPERRKKINTNLNSMNTMLLGGLWHGASWNFVIWGGLNGTGMVIFKFWKNRDVYMRTLIIMLVTLGFCFLSLRYGYPAFIIGAVWTGAIFVGTFIRMIYNLLGGTNPHATMEHAWAIAQTFVFITFTRLFFRSGSNLDPAQANKAAWETAKTMINQMACAWNTELIPQMIYGYRYVFFLIVAGMTIHWLPEHFKRRYRLSFAMLPLPAMGAMVILVVFIIYQFMTADLQKFIYFQF
jgi:alginate O-acetyltransferase complex protein AlgI